MVYSYVPGAGGCSVTGPLAVAGATCPVWPAGTGVALAAGAREGVAVTSGVGVPAGASTRVGPGAGRVCAARRARGGAGLPAAGDAPAGTRGTAARITRAPP